MEKVNGDLNLVLIEAYEHGMDAHGLTFKRTEILKYVLGFILDKGSGLKIGVVSKHAQMVTVFPDSNYTDFKDEKLTGVRRDALTYKMLQKLESSPFFPQ